MQDRRSVARTSGLIVLAFVATLILLAGLVLVVRGNRAIEVGRCLFRAVRAVRDAGRLAGFAGRIGYGQPGAGHAKRR